MKTCLGIEFGSTRIKAVSIDDNFEPVSSGGYTWKSEFKNGIWTYSMDEAWAGLKAALAEISDRENIAAMGISGMMHGYLAFDADWNLLTPFRTWQNTITAQAAEELTELLGFNIPQRWSAAHLYQAILNKEPHLEKLAHVTTLPAYVHYMLTGQNVTGVGDASAMFPVDSETGDYDQAMVDKYDALIASKGYSFKLRELFPKALLAGEDAGCLTEEGSKLLDGLLKPGIPFAPPEADAATGMTATNSVAPRTGNVSAGTSIFLMAVLEKPLNKVYTEIDIVTTPTGAAVAMVHGNNGTNDMNAWTSILGDAASIFGNAPDTGELYTKLYEKSLEGDPDCGGVVVVNYMAGEGVTHFDEGRPLVVRTPGSKFTLANFIRAQLFATMSTLRLGLDILAGENVEIDSLVAHGGLFKTPVVGQKYMAAACNAPVTVMDTAGEGGPYGMALLAAYLMMKKPGETLEDFLAKRVFAGAKSTTLEPDAKDVEGFNAYVEKFKAAIEIEKAAVKEF